MSDPTTRKRYDQAELLGQSAGLECPKCGCRHFLTRNTIPARCGIIRYRTCRHCGRVMRTVERSG